MIATITMPTDDAITAAIKVRSRKGSVFSPSHILVLLVGGWGEFGAGSPAGFTVVSAFPHSVSSAREKGEKTE